MRKLLFLLFSLIILTTALPLNAFAAYTSAFEVDSNIAYLISLDDESTVIYDKNSTQKTSPAALVKIVTGIIVIENCANLDEVVTASADSIRRLDGTGSTIAGILVGEQLSVRQLLYCMLVYNANDAVNVLVDLIGGNSENFVAMMNEFAQKLQCTDTHFTNPNGFDSTEQYTTARDMAVILKYCMKNNTFSEIISTPLYEIAPTNEYTETRYLRNTNSLLNSAISDYYFQYVKGGKSAVTSEDRCNVVSVAFKDGYNYLCVCLDSPVMDFDDDGVDENMAFVDSKKLYEWTFSNIRLRTVANKTTYVGEIEVRLSSQYDYVSVVPAEDINALVPSGVNAESVYIEIMPELTQTVVDAPIKKGDKLGRAAIKYAGETIAEVDLCAAFDVKRSAGKYAVDILLKIVNTIVFKCVAAVIVIVIVPAAVITFIKNRARRKKDKIRLVKKPDEKSK